MIYSVRLLVAIDPDSSVIPSDENEEYLVDLFHDLLYDLTDLELKAVDIERTEDV